MNPLRKENLYNIEQAPVTSYEHNEKINTKKRRGLIRRLTVFTAAALFISYVLVSTLVSQASALEAKAEEKKQLEQELAALNKDEKQLKEEIVKLNDDEYIAKIARRDYFLSEKGEIIFNIEDEQSSN